jgi:hypothetical protein
LVIAAAAGFLVALTLAITYRESYVAVVVLVFGGWLIGSLGWYLLREIDELRCGKYSFETYAYAWEEAIEQCEPLPLDTKLLQPYRRGGIKGMMAGLYRHLLIRQRPRR